MSSKRGWLGSTVIGIGLASLFSDWSHEIATAVMPAFLATMGAAAAWVGLIEGSADGLSSFAKLASGHFTDRLARRKPVAVAGYVATALGTASFGLATATWHVLVARSFAWFGRGVRTPVRKALLAAAVTKETYGRAFGFERMMDTVGAIVGPATAYALLRVYHGRFPPLFAWTLIPGLLAALCMALLVKETSRTKVSFVSFREGLRSLPQPFVRFLGAVGVFGAGDFAHTLLILLAAQKLAPVLGPGRAASIGVALYVLHNITYASFSLAAGWMADRLPKKMLLAGGYAVTALMAVGVMMLPLNPGTLAVIFILGGIAAATVETLEDSFSAEMVDSAQHGMAFGVLATVNGVGDFISSVVVGALWTAWGTTVAFGYAAVLAAVGVIILARLPSPDRHAGA
jgi:MFS family permease